MAREGIYVGGKEIIQRYVGNQLVWKKKRWITILKSDSLRNFQQLSSTVKVWCDMTKEMAKKYPPLGSQEGLQVRFYTDDSSRSVTISNVNMSHSYNDFGVYGRRDREIWTECLMEFSFSTYKDQLTFTNILKTDAGLHNIEVGKIG